MKDDIVPKAARRSFLGISTGGSIYGGICAITSLHKIEYNEILLYWEGIFVTIATRSWHPKKLVLKCNVSFDGI